MAYALTTWHGFTTLVAAHLKCPRSDENIFAMQMAAGQLVVHGSSSYGEARCAFVRFNLY